MGELVVVMLIALIFLGPKKLPEVAATLGKAIRGFRRATSELTDQLEIEDSVKRPLRELRAAIHDEPEPSRPLPNEVVPAVRSGEQVAAETSAEPASDSNDKASS